MRRATRNAVQLLCVMHNDAARTAQQHSHGAAAWKCNNTVRQNRTTKKHGKTEQLKQ
jgi:hypothetical protein